MAEIKGTFLEPVTSHGVRAGFVTTAYRNGVSDKEIMGQTKHRSLTTRRSYVRRVNTIVPPACGCLVPDSGRSIST